MRKFYFEKYGEEITQEEEDQLKIMVQNIKESKVNFDIKGETEKAMEFDIFGIPFYGIFDVLTDDEVVDYKTTGT
jgi:hypothetical protein